MRRRIQLFRKVFLVTTKARPNPQVYGEEHAENARVLLENFVEKARTQERAAKALGVSQTRISRILSREEQPSLALLIELRREMQVPLDVILGLPLLLDEQVEARRVQRLLGAPTPQRPSLLKP